MLGAFLALVAPALIAAHDPPSITFYNQALAVLGWGGLVWAMVRSSTKAPAVITHPWAQRAWFALLGVGLIHVAVSAWSSWWGQLPGGLAMMSGGLSAAACLVAWAGWHTGHERRGDELFDLFAAALCVTGVLSMVLGLIQAFYPQWADGNFIAAPTMPGRAVGNLRQPNHLSTMLVWCVVSAAWLGGRGRLPSWLSTGLMALFIYGIVLTASRTGMVAMGFLLLWGLLDKQLPRSTRASLILAPAMYGLFWGFMWWLAHAAQGVTFAAEARLHDNSDISSSRFKIWANVLDLIRAHPLTGVGWGEFNVAWTFTEFPQRPIAFFDHTHNLVLQWAVELGLPLTVLLVLMCAVAGWVLIWPGRADRLRPAGACGVIVSTAMLHSLLEYPLWYSYFLLPMAFAWGAGLASRASTGAASLSSTSTGPGRSLTWAATAAAVMMGGAIWCALDFQAAANIYAPRPGAGPLDKRIAFGQGMPWFGYQADYAYVTVPDEDEPTKPPQAFARTLHNLVDARLMIAYARSLHEAGETDKARYIVARLKEFKNSLTKPFLAPCEAASTPADAEGPDRHDADVSSAPFQCSPPSRSYHWRELLPDQVASRTQ